MTDPQSKSSPPFRGRIAVVVSRYNRSITDNLRAGAVDTLRQAGIEEHQIAVAYVPGAWELPLVVQHYAREDSCVAVIALGAVIQGETTHDEHINRSVSTALMEIGLRTQKPVLMGVLTCRTVEQAINRSGGSMGNKGSECAEAAVEMIQLMHSLRHSME